MLNYADCGLIIGNLSQSTTPEAILAGEVITGWGTTTEYFYIFIMSTEIVGDEHVSAELKVPCPYFVLRTWAFQRAGIIYLRSTVVESSEMAQSGRNIYLVSSGRFPFLDWLAAQYFV